MLFRIVRLYFLPYHHYLILLLHFCLIGPTFCLTLLSPLAYEKKNFRLFLHAAIALSSFCFLSLLWEARIFLSISILSSFSFSLNGLFKIRLSNFVLLLINILRSLGIRLFLQILLNNP